MNAKVKPLPAYARELADARRRGMTLRDPTVSVRLHGLRRPCLGYGVALPSDLDPAQCDWSFLRGCEVIVFRFACDSTKRLISATRAIEAARPRRLVIVDACDPSIISIVRSERPSHAS